MPKDSDRNRILKTLLQDGGLSNARIRALTKLEDDRYLEVKNELLKENLVKKYQCRGGGLRLTRRGKQHVDLLANPEGQSAVSKERELYEPLIALLQEEVEQDDADRTIVRDTSSLMIQGKWSNPDVTSVEIKQYEYLNKHELYITTYEVKKWESWDVSAVFEAASHARFAHEAYIVLEWARGVELSLEDNTYGVDKIVAACGRFGVGLITLHPFRSGWSHEVHIDAIPKVPSDQDADYFLSVFFEKYDREWEWLRKQLR